ncbi:MAG: hypothetical protein V3W18_12880 [candidate division Zixibacteria bacterium]
MHNALLIADKRDRSTKIIEFLRAAFSDIYIENADGPEGEFLSAENYDMLIFSEKAFKSRGKEFMEKFRGISHAPVVCVLPDSFSGRKLNLKRANSKDSTGDNKSTLLSVKNPVSRAIEIRDFKVEKGDTDSVLERFCGRRDDLNSGQWKKHKINNLLMTIIGNAQILQTKPKISREKFIKKLQTIERTAKIIARINDYQDKIALDINSQTKGSAKSVTD